MYACVRINNILTDRFNYPNRVKQGCNLSPTFFAIFVNDLVQEINYLQLGIEINETSISMLLYADDIVLISDSPDNLQTMLNTMHNWCKRWRVLINCEKSKVVHFRKGRAKQYDYKFRIGDNSLETVGQI